MRKMRILIIAILVVIILVGGALALNLFAFGKVKDVSSIGVQNLSVTNEKIFFSPVFMSSADIMGNYSYRIENDIMYVKIKSILVGGLGIPNVEIKGDFSSLQKIVLEDNENEKVIWEK